jgi:hypothetical protein
VLREVNRVLPEDVLSQDAVVISDEPCRPLVFEGRRLLEAATVFRRAAIAWSR